MFLIQNLVIGFLLWLIIIKIVNMAKYNRDKGEISFIEPFISKFHKLEKGVKIEEDELPITELMLVELGPRNHENENIFAKENVHLLHSNREIITMNDDQNWYVYIPGKFTRDSDVSTKDIKHILRYTTKKFEEYNEPFFITLSHKNRSNYIGPISEKYYYSFPSKRFNKSLLDYPYIMNKQAFDIIFCDVNDTNDVKVVNINAIHDDNGDVFLEGNCGIYKWGGLFYIKEEDNVDKKITFLDNICGHILF